MVQKIELDMVDGLTAALGSKAPVIGTATDTGVTAALAALPPVTAWIAYTPTFVGHGTVTGISVRSRRVGSNLELQGSFTTGTSTASTATMSLGFNGVNGGIAIASAITARSIAGMIASASVSAGSFYLLMLGGESDLKFGIQASGLPAVTARSNVFDPGVSVTFQASIPIQGW